MPQSPRREVGRLGERRHSEVAHVGKMCRGASVLFRGAGKVGKTKCAAADGFNKG